MKRLILVLSIIISTNIAIAEYTINVPLESEQGGTLPQGSIIISPMNQTENWIIISPTYTNWVNDGDPFNCTNWSPEQNTVATGQNFTQTATDCEQNQTRTRQDREQETTTLEIRNVGTPVTENQTLINQSNTRSNIGTQEIWFAITPIYTSWINSGSIYGCTNWSPETNTVTIGQSFTQTANDCKQDQIRTRQDREQETTTLDYRNVGSPVEENQTLTNQTNTRNAIGTMESWVAADPIYTAWANSGVLYDCTNWSPLENTVGLGTNFEQTATDCKQNQTRTRQDREQETTTLAYRDVGSLLTENQTLTNQINTRNAVGTMETWVAATPVYTSWVNSGGIYGCSNWSPATSTVTIGQNFTQTATDCEQDQTRTRQNREQETTTLVYRNSGSLVTENQTLSNQTSTRNAVGTKETWVATTPVYTSWVNSGGIYGCSNWSPATSTVTSGQTFTQTATDCKQDQTRTRQDREQETTTLAIRNAGSLVTENQTLTNQSNTRTATGTKVSTECKFDNPYGHTSNPQYYWVIEENVNSATHDPTALVWNNATLNTSYSQYYYDWENMPKNLTSLTHAGYTYTRGPLWGDDGVYRFYTICRTPL